MAPRKQQKVEVVIRPRKAKRKGKEALNEAKQVVNEEASEKPPTILGDITSLYIPSRPATPQKPLSPLPPSSPPSPSSDDLHIPIATEPDVLPEPQTPTQYHNSDFSTPGQLPQFGTVLVEGSDPPRADESFPVVIESDPDPFPPKEDSDPFGFMTVERDLKARRLPLGVLETPKRTGREFDFGFIDSDQENRVIPEDKENEQPIRRLEFEEPELEPELEPSDKENEVMEEEEDKENAAHEPLKRRREEEEVEELLDPKRMAVEESEEEEEFQPRRSARHAKAAASPPVVKSPTKSPAKKPRSKRSASTSKKPRSRAKSKGKQKEEEPEEVEEEPLSDQEDQSEKLERQRQERIEYFEKLKNYSMEKEYVFVV